MAILTYIDGVPLYTSAEEAEQWANAINITGYHTHMFKGSMGYMGGLNHMDINTALQNKRQSSYVKKLNHKISRNKKPSVAGEPVTPPITTTVTPAPVQQPTRVVQRQLPQTTPGVSPGTASGGGGYSGGGGGGGY